MSTTPTQSPTSTPRSILVDIGLAFLMVYIVGLTLALTHDPALSTLPKSLFFFVLCLFLPFVAIPDDPIGLIYIAFFVALFVLIFRYVPALYRKFALAAALAGWEYYGLYCLILVTGGA